MTSSTDREGVSAQRPLALGFGAVAVLALGAAAWSLLASVSGAVIANGRVVVENRNQVVEHRDGGTVVDVLVRDGDIVAPGDLLLRLADSLARSEEAMLQARFNEYVARGNRLQAEFLGADLVWDVDLVAQSRTDPKVGDMLESQRRLFEARRTSRANHVARLHERIERMREEIVGLDAQARSIDEQSALIEKELDAHRALFKDGLTRLDRLLALERAAKDLDGRAGSNAAAVARARSQIAELEIEILQVDARRIEEAEAQARDAAYEANQVRELLLSARERRAGKEIRAPVAGVVFGMSVARAHEVVRPGEPILQIVPQDARLVVVARIEPIHVDQVHLGQQAILRFSAFPAQVTPEVEGHVVRVSADAVLDGETGLSWYEVDLAAAGPASGGATASDMPALAGDLVVAPGMPVEVHIQTAERTVISYLLKPITDFFLRSMREE